MSLGGYFNGPGLRPVLFSLLPEAVDRMSCAGKAIGPLLTAGASGFVSTPAPPSPQALTTRVKNTGSSETVRDRRMGGSSPLERTGTLLPA